MCISSCIWSTCHIRSVSKGVSAGLPACEPRVRKRCHLKNGAGLQPYRKEAGFFFLPHRGNKPIKPKNRSFCEVIHTSPTKDLPNKARLLRQIPTSNTAGLITATLELGFWGVRHGLIDFKWLPTSYRPLAKHRAKQPCQNTIVSPS